MSSPQGSPAGRVGQSYMLVPNLHVPDPTLDEVELGSSNAWTVATVIEDDDLMFGGKPLSAWYEEDRRRLSSSNEDEEEIRGRQRDRVRIAQDTVGYTASPTSAPLRSPSPNSTPKHFYTHLVAVSLISGL
ncbi:hypothetical protein N0V85_007192 [Neurospora sp. IMI 360204]|nr:hypothetical protein N0V85_007192 [Neurospora sp. IMI 360204]